MIDVLPCLLSNDPASSQTIAGLVAYDVGQTTNSVFGPVPLLFFQAVHGHVRAYSRNGHDFGMAFIASATLGARATRKCAKRCLLRRQLALGETKSNCSTVD